MLRHHLIQGHLMQKCRPIRRQSRTKDHTTSKNPILKVKFMLPLVPLSFSRLRFLLNLVAPEVAIYPERIDQGGHWNKVKCHLGDYFVSLLRCCLGSSLCSSSSQIMLSENSVWPKEREVVADEAGALCSVWKKLNGLAAELIDIAKLESSI